jgi:hypothetical protein
MCDMVTSGDSLVGKRIDVLVRITATKEGAFLWDPGCHGRVVAISFARPAQNQPDILELRRAMKDYGLSDHPVMAAVTGTLLLNRRDEVHPVLHNEFQVDAASDVHLSAAPEHP